MKTKQLFALIISLLIFLTGIAIGLYFNIRAVWSDLEATSFWGYPEALLYDRSIETEAKLSSLRCPVLITPSDAKFLTVKVVNKQAQEIKPMLQISVSDPTQKENIQRNYFEPNLAPQESEEITYLLTSQNFIDQRIIYVRVFLMNSEYFPPSETRHCGVFVGKLGNLNSAQLIGTLIASSLLLVGLGLGLWWHSSSEQMKRTKYIFNRMLWLAAFMLITILMVLLGWHLLAIIFLLLTTLLIFSILENFVMDSINKQHEPVV